jgi:alpha-tubulin suppressor-like RCC1 family protein
VRTFRGIAVAAGVAAALVIGGSPAGAVAPLTNGAHRPTTRVGVRATAVPIQIAGANEQNCAVMSNRTVECWGSNAYGDLGDGNLALATRPVIVQGLVGVKQVALGFGHTCALLSSGEVGCWGWNANGQLGDGSEHSTVRPVMVQGLADVSQISLGFETSCALLYSGSVKCWGWNFNGELGDGATGTTQTPVTVVGLAGAREVAVGYAHTCAVVARGAVRCWGLNDEGQLGDGGTRQSSSPVAVRGLVGVRGIALGAKHTCAVLVSGEVKCWGWNQFGQLGDGTTVSTQVPVEVSNLNDAIDVSAAYGDSCALLRTHRVRCWGSNEYGQLGTSNRLSTDVPVGTRNLINVVQLTASDEDSCALLLVHAYSCWGSNGQGELGIGSLISDNTPPYLPGPPLAVRAQSMNGAVRVSWHPPLLDGDSPIVRYTATSSTGQQACSIRGYSCIVSGLTNGIPYTFRVMAANVVGSSRPTLSASVIPATTPGAPTDVAVQREDNGALVSWIPPTSDGGRAITAYTATASPGGNTCRTTSGDSCSIGGLTNGDTYTVTVTATNLVGPGPASALSGPVIPAKVPGQPMDVTATPGNTIASVTWIAASANGSPITTYEVTATDETNALRGGETCSTSGSIGCTVTGLTNGDAYIFVVTATNTEGLGPTSTPSSPVTPATVPGVPTGVVALAGDTTADVTWTAPVANGGSAITRYQVTATDTTTSANGGQTCTGTVPTTGCVVTGLTNGNSYTFTVTATNVAGTSLASAPSLGITPAAPPGAPTGVLAIAGDASATVTWTTPTADGGSPITSYEVSGIDTKTPANGGQSCTGTDPATGCVVTGLTNGDTYTFTVKATNAAGTGAASIASSSITPAAPPGAPRSPGAAPHDASAAVNWLAPTTDGGSAITGYVVTATDHTNAGNGGETCSTGGALACTVSALTNGDSYTFTVTATNGAGTGPSSAASVAVVPYTVPDPPVAVAAAPGNRFAAIAWSAPFDGGRAISQYDVTATDHTTSANGGETCSTSGSIGCTVSGLTDGDSYTFTVTATNSTGMSNPSSPSSAVTPATVPDAPTGVTGTPGDTTVDVSWTAPGFDGGSAINGYSVTATDQTTSANGGETCSTSGSIGCTVTGLTDGDAYIFTVTATNSVGTSNPSSPSSAVTPMMGLLVLQPASVASIDDFNAVYLGDATTWNTPITRPG